VAFGSDEGPDFLDFGGFADEKELRTMPMWVRPIKLFFSARRRTSGWFLWVGSLSKGKLSLCFSLNETRALTGSALMPRMATPRWSNCFFASRNSDASMVNRECWLGKEKEEDTLAGEVLERDFQALVGIEAKAGALAPT